jgi:hypothetical protein
VITTSNGIPVFKDGEARAYSNRFYRAVPF